MVFVWPSQRNAQLSPTPFWNPEMAVPWLWFIIPYPSQKNRGPSLTVLFGYPFKFFDDEDFRPFRRLPGPSFPVFDGTLGNLESFRHLFLRHPGYFPCFFYGGHSATTSFPSLTTSWVSRAVSSQRAGRTISLSYHWKTSPSSGTSSGMGTIETVECQQVFRDFSKKISPQGNPQGLHHHSAIVYVIAAASTFRPVLV